MSVATARILHARVPASGHAAATRLGLERWLAGIELARLGLPAQAIVIVRRLRTSCAALAGQGGDPLAAALRGAMRPARQDFVGAGVGVVWFADDAELLACLARDVVAGALGARWWWPLLCGREATPALALQHWTAQAHAVPQALHQMAPSGLARAWLDLLGRNGRGALLAALAQAYPVCVTVQRCIELAESDDTGLTPAAAVRAGVAAISAPDEARAMQVEAATPLSASLALLRLAEVLRSEPQRAADTRLVLVLRSAAHAQPIALPATAARLAVASSTSAKARPGPSSAATPGGEQEPTHAAPTVPPAHSASGRPARADTGLAAARAELPHVFTAPSVAAPAAARSPTRVAALAPTQAPDLAPTLASPPAETFHTAFAGLCFLFNVALALGLYGDFTQPRHVGLPLSPWRLLHAAGRACFGRAFAADALAPWLLQRAGPPSPMPALPPWLWPLMRTRLSLALGARGGRSATRRALALPATMHARAGRLDLHFSLATLPLAVRLAGLDRDPGWIPAAGADIRFHFD